MRFEELAATPASAVHLTRHVIDVTSTASESGGRREYREDGGKTNAAKRHIIIIPQAVPVLRRLQAIRKKGAEREPARDAARLARPTRAKRDKSGQPGKRRLPNRPIEQRWLLLAGGAQGGFQGYGHYRKRLAEAQVAAGVDYDAHDLRHVCASVLIVSGATKARSGTRWATKPPPPQSVFTGTSSPWTAASSRPWSACPGTRSRPPRPQRPSCWRTLTGEAIGADRVRRCLPRDSDSRGGRRVERHTALAQPPMCRFPRRTLQVRVGGTSLRSMWEYVSMWHQLNWTTNASGHSEHAGWRRWVMAPATASPPEPDAGDAEALNFMGSAGWEVIHRTFVMDMPPNVTNTIFGNQTHEYLFKRPRKA